MTSTLVNSFSHPLGHVHYDIYRPEDVGPALDTAEASASQQLDRIVADAGAGAGDPMAALGDATARTDFIATIATDLAAVLGGAWHDAARLAAVRAARFRSGIYQRRDLCEAIRATMPGSPAAERLRTDLLRRFERSGAHLGPDARRRLAAIDARLADLAADFTSNLQAADATAGFWVAEAAAAGDATGAVATVDGLPDALVASARAAADARGLGGFYFAYSNATAAVVLREAHDPALREAMYRLGITRAAADNGPVVAEILALRQELATLLGHADYAQLAGAGRMVADPQAFLDDMIRAYRPHADREQAELLAFARATSGDPDLELTAADVDLHSDGYYASRLRETRGLASGASVRVPVATAVRVMLDAVGELYGVTFTRIDAAAWHPDVEVHEMRDRDGRIMARIWCDWLARDGKRAAPPGWMSGPWLATDGGPHLLTVVTNIAPDGADLKHLRVMWHEFGHAMHFAFTRTPYRMRSPDDCPLDFIEGPSRVMENWPLEPEILRRMGVDETIAAAVREDDRFRIASRKMVALVRPAIDLAVHRGENPVEVKQRLLGVPVHPDDATAAQFHHIFAAEYGAAHYAYQWAGVMDANLFARFAADGVLNPVTGRAYAEIVLAAGAERDPAELIREFLGHDIDVRAALARDGVA